MSTTTRTSLVPFGGIYFMPLTPPARITSFSLCPPIASPTTIPVHVLVNVHAHAHAHAHNPLSSTFAVALCLSLTSRIFQIWFLFVLPRLMLSLLLLLHDDAPRWCWLPHGDIWNLSRRSGGGDSQLAATITQYIVIYPVAIRQSFRLHLHPPAAPSPRFSPSLLASLFGKRSWNVLGCILVHMCSRVGAKGLPSWLFEKITSFRFQRSPTNYYVFIVYNTY